MLLCCKEKLIRHEKAKLQARTVISLQFACLYIYRSLLQGRIQDFFLGGGALDRLLLYFNTNKPNSFFFLAEYQLY